MLRKIKNKYQEAKLKNAQKREERKQHFHHLHSQPTAFDDVDLAWIAPETIRHERGTIWKAVMISFVIAFIVGGIITNAWTFSLAIAAFALVYYLVHLEHPKDVEVKVSAVGIKVGGRNYSYNSIKAFWIIYEPPYVKTLNIRVQGKFNSDITIQLNGQHPGQLREFLIEKIPEMDGQDEKLSDILLRILKI